MQCTTVVHFSNDSTPLQSQKLSVELHNSDLSVFQRKGLLYEPRANNSIDTTDCEGRPSTWVLLGFVLSSPTDRKQLLSKMCTTNFFPPALSVFAYKVLPTPPRLLPVGTYRPVPSLATICNILCQEFFPGSL
jgi:hypothetical protein